MHGGRPGEFSALAYNAPGLHANTGKLVAQCVPELKSALKNLKMDYIITGSWPQKAAAEAERLFGSE
jgi:phosphoserine aminotransferase